MRGEKFGAAQVGTRGPQGDHGKSAAYRLCCYGSSTAQAVHTPFSQIWTPLAQLWMPSDTPRSITQSRFAKSVHGSLWADELFDASSDCTPGSSPGPAG